MDVLINVFRALIGVGGILGIAYLISSDKKRINWLVVAGGLLLQLVIATGVLLVSWIEAFFGMIATLFALALDISVKAAGFVFGPLSDFESMAEVFGNDNGFVFAFMALPSILFFSALSSLLYYFGVLQFIVKMMAWVLSRVMRLSGAESLAAAANVFVGQTEAPLLVKPYIPEMTKSEILSLMVGGMATIAGSVFAIYMGMLGGGDKESMLEFGRFLLCASAMNAPAALLIAKIIIPQTKEVSSDLSVSRETIGRNPIDALANGTTQGLQLALNVGAMLIAFYAVIMLVNEILSGVGLMPWVGGGSLNDWIFTVSEQQFEVLRSRDTRSSLPQEEVVKVICEKFNPGMLAITLGSEGMLLAKEGKIEQTIPTAAQEVFDVSGAGDTVIASLTLALVSGASLENSAHFANLAAGIVVGKVGTATASPNEILRHA